MGVMMTKDYMLYRIDLVADTIRSYVVGDAVRAFEYKQAELDAREFKKNGYIGDIPKSIQTWIESSGKTKEEATDNIIYEADMFNGIMLAIRDLRLKGKAEVRNAETDEGAEVAFNDCITKLKNLLV